MGRVTRREAGGDGQQQMAEGQVQRRSVGEGGLAALALHLTLVTDWQLRASDDGQAARASRAAKRAG